MKCEIIWDLLPLYHDECCSDESACEVEAHLETCPACRAVLQDIKLSLPIKSTAVFPKLELVRHWRASSLQLTLFVLAFLMLFAGAMAEASIGSSYINGRAALTLLVPGVACLFSLTSWFFLRLYKSRKQFVIASAVIAAVTFAAALVWVCLHYRFFAGGWEHGINVLARHFGIMFGYGWFTYAAYLHMLLSPLYAYLYARWMGKE